MKKTAKRKITVQDYVKAQRRISREEEFALHGKQVSLRIGSVHKSKRAYDRARYKKETKDENI